jgi:hypothetical protein
MMVLILCLSHKPHRSQNIYGIGIVSATLGSIAKEGQL